MAGKLQQLGDIISQLFAPYFYYAIRKQKKVDTIELNIGQDICW